MKLFFLPFVREGFMPAAIGAGRARAQLPLQLQAAGQAPLEVGGELPLLGPGDVVGLDPRQVLRVAPAAGTHDAEPEFFPAIEFDAPDLPWAYGPQVPEGARVQPWLVLVVVQAMDGVSVGAGAQGQSPWILRLPAAVAARELPDLTDSWAWAHAQVACESTARIEDTLAQHPDLTLSRLLAPRRLLPSTTYHACVVPAFLAGRVAGLGELPAQTPAIVTGAEPAWTAADPPTVLPVYYTWSFRTGEAGDFESLAQRLRAAPLDATLPPTPLHLSLPSGDGNLVVDWEAPLHAPGATPSRPRRPAAATRALKNALHPGTTRRPILGPAYFGEPWMPGRPLTPLSEWRVEINLTPMLRAAAGLGAEVVRAEQDALVAAASEQLEALRAQQRKGRQQQLAAAFAGRMSRRLQQAPPPEAARVLAPLAVVKQQAASNVGAFTVAGRRIARKDWMAADLRAVRDTDAVRDPEPAPRADPLRRRGPPLARDRDPQLAAELSAHEVPPIQYRPVVVRVPVAEPTTPPPLPAPQSIPTGAFVPRFGRPMSEPLAERHPELMVPDASAIKPDSALLVQSDNAFVEAFLLGANQELHHELLWRGLPADPRATAFRRFWPRAGAAAAMDDIGDIAAWPAAGSVGSHVGNGAALILLVRSELVRRYPSLHVAMVPAGWQGSGRLPVAGAEPSLPMFRGRIGADVLYAGFSAPSLIEAIGTTTPIGDAGWYLLLSENPGDPRFGLDPPGNMAPPTRASLSWSHLSAAASSYAAVASFPDVPDAHFTSANANAANLANLVRQRPFRAFLHASLLVRLPA